MSIVTVPSTCNCTLWDMTDTSVRICKEHHRYHRGPKELTSVSKILRTVWPVKPDFAAADPEVLESARDRGTVVDELFSLYVNGTLTKIPAGTRTDAVDLFLKLRRWWDQRDIKAQAQVMLADNDIAGTCDILTEDGWIYDIKATYSLEGTYPLQLGAYAQLIDDHFPVLPHIAIIHVTKRFDTPKVIELDAKQCIEDWLKVRAMWEVVQRRTA